MFFSRFRSALQADPLLERVKKKKGEAVCVAKHRCLKHSAEHVRMPGWMFRCHILASTPRAALQGFKNFTKEAREILALLTKIDSDNYPEVRTQKPWAELHVQSGGGLDAVLGACTEHGPHSQDRNGREGVVCSCAGHPFAPA